VQLLDVGFVAVSSGVKSRSTKGFGKICRKPHIMVRVEFMLEGVSRHFILKTQLVPAPREGEDPVKSAQLVVKRSHGRNLTWGYLVGGTGFEPVGCRRTILETESQTDPIGSIASSAIFPSRSRNL